MIGRFLWVDGRLNLLPGHFKSHREMIAKYASPVNYVAGDFVMGEIPTVKFVVSNGDHPTEDEVRQMIQIDLGRYGRESRAHEMIQSLAVNTEDTEPAGKEVGFLRDPHKNLYPYLFPEGGTVMPEKVKHLLKSHVLNQLEEAFEDPDNFIYFTVYGSGVAYNWDEGGDLDVQMWIDIEKFQALNEDKATWTMDDLLAEVRRNVQMVNFPTVKDIGLSAPLNTDEDTTGDMLIQYYPKPGKGTEEENLAQKPYSCLDLETGKWIVKPKPIDPTFYGLHFLELMPKATDMAIQAEALLDEFERNVLNWQFWFSLYSRYRNPAYHEQYQEAQRNAIMEQAGIKTMFKGIFGGRQDAYSPEGKGIEDERDMLQKLLEVWGLFQRLKHYARVPLPWDELELPGSPEKVESSWPAPSLMCPRCGEGPYGSVELLKQHSDLRHPGWNTQDVESKWRMAGAEDSPEHRDPGGWAGIMQKAQRLREQGGVQVTNNGAQQITGVVQGDHGTYNTQIWRQDPSRNTISLWDCDCPWNDYSWGRTRQFKKYEGRPCAHTLALYWQALSQPLDDEGNAGDQMQIPGIDPYAQPGQQPGQVDLNQALQQTVKPAPKPSELTGPPPGGNAMTQEQLTFPGTFSKWRKQGALQNGDYARINKALIGYDDRGTQYTVPRNSIVEIIWSDESETIAIYSLGSGPLGPHNARITSETSDFTWVPRTRGTAPRRRH